MGQVVDTESAREFMKEVRAGISEDEMEAIAVELAEKSRRFQALLSGETLPSLGRAEIRSLLRSVFSTRRKAERLLDAFGADGLRDRIGALLYGDGDVPGRFDAFCDSLDDVETTMRYDLAGELLHYNSPERFWLWTRWMWNPENDTGALRLVTMDGVDLRGSSFGETYLRVGEAVAFVSETAKAAGFQRGSDLFGTTVYLAAVYVVYIYTALKLRMTQEFNKVVPKFPELSRRILGVHSLEV